MLKLEIVTPLRRMLSTEADYILLPGSEGQLGILPDHIPLVTTLDTGLLLYTFSWEKHAVAVHWGYVQVDSNRVTVLAELGEVADEIDLNRAKLAEKKARDVLKTIKVAGKDSDSEKQRMDKFEAKLRRSLIRQQVSTFN